ncbi:glycosyltransferase 87 family protein [Streptomyces sp. NPDC050804]|uniref:glycosyltransferase 87 family protein n=1 Tax=Streptomyces sp. NPDC050804 TaxID=3154745 RepID=UPI003430280F
MSTLAPFAGRARAGRSGVRTAGTLVLLAGVVTATTVSVRTGGVLARPERILLWYAVAWAMFAAACWAVRAVPVRRATAVILAGSAALALTGLAGPPSTSSDMFRYAWDGTVQAAGISPYAYPPAAPELTRLRDPWLFPPDSACQDPATALRLELHTFPAAQDGPGAQPTECTRINRPQAHTIYPPVAEWWFFAVHELSPADGRHKPFQAAGAVLAFATTAALLAVLRRRGRDPRTAALWGWCPAVPVEAVNNAHVDTLGVLLTVLALGAVGPGGRRGVLLGAATAVKLLPVLALLGSVAGRRSMLRTVAPAVAAFVLVYLPYAAVSGGQVLGYLPGYLKEEGYEPGDVRRFALLRLLLPDVAAAPVAATLIALTAVYVWRRGDPEQPWQGALLVTGTTLTLVSPGYSWYALLVVGLVALDGRAEWLTVPAAGAVLYVGNAAFPQMPLQALAYGAAALVVCGAAAHRHWSGRGPSPAAETLTRVPQEARPVERNQEKRQR